MFRCRSGKHLALAGRNVPVSIDVEVPIFMELLDHMLGLDVLLFHLVELLELLLGFLNHGEILVHLLLLELFFLFIGLYLGVSPSPLVAHLEHVRGSTPLFYSNKWND